MTIYLVRHAHAGKRDRWDGDDRTRPLSDKGWSQAKALAARLAPLSPAALWSSPYERCRQTLEPLAEITGFPIADSPALSEGADIAAAIELLAGVDLPAVCCTHGDVVPSVVDTLAHRGMEVTTPADWRKATIWVIAREGGEFARAHVWPPPTV